MQARILSYKEQNFTEQLAALVRGNHSTDAALERKVAEIISLIKQEGDDAIIKMSNQFDRADFKKGDDLLVTAKEIDAAKKNADPQLIEALKTAYLRIYHYHQKQMPADFSYHDEHNVEVGNRWQPIESVGVYVPGGTASYPSSVLMSAVPAIVAGVTNISITVPSVAGKVNESVLVAADLCGIKTIYKIGGAAAVAAMAFGTKTVKKVDKIVGPGNSFVALAKKQLFGEIGIDMIAGPTDILIIADRDINPDWIAADMLSQLEHGADSRAVLITDDFSFADAVNEALGKLATKLSRKKIIAESLKNNGVIIVVSDLLHLAPEIANQIAPEHLEITASDCKKIAARIKNAGAIFLGKYSPEAIGDYIAGPSHTLPTMGSARFASGLSVFDFLKRISTISCSREGFFKLQKSTALMAEAEGFDAHKLSVTIRNSE